MANPASDTGGVKPMAIAGRMVRERERLFGMSDAERAWRAQWLKDQVLAPDEPKVPEGYYKARYNVLRRFYRAPMDKVEAALTKPLGPMGAGIVRNCCAKAAMSMMVVWSFWYHIKYYPSDWTRKTGLKVSASRKAVYPNDPGFPKYKTYTDDEYASFGFKNAPM